MPVRLVAAGFVGFGLALAAVGPLSADTLPARKAGLWESKTVSAEGNVTARQCIDEKTDQMAQGALGAGQCSKRDFVKTSTGYRGETECKIGPISASGTSVITGDFASKVHLDVDTTLTGVPGMKEPVRRKMVIDASYLGPCEAGQNPGDIILPDGKIVKMPQGAGR
jgi:hypothetical protein